MADSPGIGSLYPMSFSKLRNSARRGPSHTRKTPAPSTFIIPAMEPINVQQTYETARRNHSAGKLPEAEAGYRDVLARDPAHADAMLWLGILAQGAGRLAEAADLTGRAAKLKPGDAAFHAT